MKKICVSVVGSGQLHEINIQPGTTAGDILRDLNLADYLLSKTPSADFFANTESIYDKVAEGEKIFASTKATVGSNLLSRITKTISTPFTGSNAGEKVSSVRRWIASQISAVKVIRRHVRPYFQEAGWLKTGNVYKGNYQTHYGAYEGWIEERSPHEIRFFILQPPDCVLHSSHGPCFQHLENNWFQVHMSARPKDISSGIAAIERLIAECFRNRR